MLALTRRPGEEIVIGDPANPLGVIRIVDVHSDKVRLSFDFPRDIEINRRELADQKIKQQRPPSPAATPAVEDDASSPAEEAGRP
jgi:carbon storage regulator CsrA